MKRNQQSKDRASYKCSYTYYHLLIKESESARLLVSVWTAMPSVWKFAMALCDRLLTAERKNELTNVHTKRHASVCEQNVISDFKNRATTKYKTDDSVYKQISMRAVNNFNCRWRWLLMENMRLFNFLQQLDCCFDKYI